MSIKRMMAGLMAGILMMGTLSTTCFAAAADSDSTEKKPDVISENATTTSGVADTKETEEEKLAAISCIAAQGLSILHLLGRVFSTHRGSRCRGGCH